MLFGTEKPFYPHSGGQSIIRFHCSKGCSIHCLKVDPHTAKGPTPKVQESANCTHTCSIQFQTSHSNHIYWGRNLISHSLAISRFRLQWGMRTDSKPSEKWRWVMTCRYYERPEEKGIAVKGSLNARVLEEMKMIRNTSIYKSSAGIWTYYGK